jgi:hypothetical protein
MKNYYYFEDDDEDERRKRRRKTKTKTKDENGVDRKRTEERRKLIQNKCALVSSQKIRMRKEEGATVAATPTFPHSWLAVSLVRRAGRQ